MKIKEILFKTILNDGYEYDDRYKFNGKIEDLKKYNFKKLNDGEIIEELKIKVSKENEAYYKKSGLGYFIAYIEENIMNFMSGVPIWWIGDEEKTDYYNDLSLMEKDGLIEKI